MDTTHTILIAAVVILVVLNIVATLVVVSSPSLTISRKALQIALAWVLPLVGAVLCIAIHRSDKAPLLRQKSQDFTDPGPEIDPGP
jgi:hypothetical protein